MSAGELTQLELEALAAVRRLGLSRQPGLALRIGGRQLLQDIQLAPGALGRNREIIRKSITLDFGPLDGTHSRQLFWHRGRHLEIPCDAVSRTSDK